MGPVPYDGAPDGPRPLVSEYGWLEKGALWPGTRERLRNRCASANPPARVWTPGHDRLVDPIDVPWLFEARKEPALAKLREKVKAAGFIFGIFALITVLAYSGGPDDAPHGPPLLLLVTGVAFAQSLLAYRRMKALTPAELRAQVEEARGLPPARTGEPVVTRALAVAIGVVAAAQVVSPGSSFETAGLVKDAVRHGEWWRLFTAPLLHGNPLHLLMNGGALLALGTLVERYAHRAFVPLVFLAAALAGGAGSFAAFPHKTSVGASGGIMGLVGFALVMSLRRRELLPRSLAKALAQDVGWIALMGVAAYQYIDNGAHAGGLLAGIALGALLVPRGGGTPHWEPAPAIRMAGWAAAAVLAASAAAAIAAMFGALPL
jgi:membrane associated rhomboid family serine protease